MCGGFGTRLGELTAEMPKPMLPVDGKPFLCYLIEDLHRFGIKEIVLCTGYLSNIVEDYFSDGSKFDVSIIYSVEEEPLGTGGSLKLAERELKDSFFVLNGDSLFDINYLELRNIVLNRPEVLAALALREVESSDRFGVVSIDSDGLVKSFQEKAVVEKNVLVNGGIYYFEKKILDLLPKGKASIEHDLLPKLVKSSQLSSSIYNNFLIDIGIPADYEKVQYQLPQVSKKPAVFFDRDGVLNYDYGHVHTKEKFDWIPGAIDAIKLCNDNNFYVFIVTNQAGIGKELYNEDDFFNLCNWMEEYLASFGAHVDQIYYCPYYQYSTKPAYRIDENCRKPNAGMIEQAFANWGILKEKSLLLGDKHTDIQAADKCGLQSILFKEKDHNILDLVTAHVEQIQD